MITISLCMIVKDEENTLERCLASASAIADEIIIVDTGSTDCTKKVAAGFTDKIYDFEWVDDFSAARNFAFGKASKDYLLWLDADDIIFPMDMANFRLLKSTLRPDVDAVMMKYNTGFDPQGKVNFSYYRERLVRRDRGFRWREPVHEYLEVGGKIIESDIGITHAKQRNRPNTRNIEIYEALLAGGETLSPRGMYYYARELKDNGRYREAIAMFGQFLDSGNGWVEDNITACSELAKCYQIEKKDAEALAAMLRSFQFDTPRAELCCQIGYYFKLRGQWRWAAFWFGLALKLERPQNSWGFVQEDCWGYIPSIECAVCYDNLGDYDKAEQYNSKASEFKPNAPEVLYNKKYFEGRRQDAISAAKGDDTDVATDIPNHQS